jgi:hypothetical protein
MKINKKKLTDFLKKVNMSGSERIEEAIFNFMDNGLSINAVANTKISMINALLNKSAFTEYEAIGEIGIPDLSLIIRILDKFDDELSFIIEGSLIKFFDKNKEMTTELLNTEFITKANSQKELTHDEIISLNAEVLKDIISDATINKDYNLQFKTEPKKLIIETTGKFKFKREFNIPEVKGGVIVTFGQPFVDNVGALTDDLLLHLKAQYPIKIFEKTDDSVITIIAAPRMND